MIAKLEKSNIRALIISEINIHNYKYIMISFHIEEENYDQVYIRILETDERMNECVCGLYV